MKTDVNISLLHGPPENLPCCCFTSAPALTICPRFPEHGAAGRCLAAGQCLRPAGAAPPGPSAPRVVPPSRAGGGDTEGDAAGTRRGTRQRRRLPALRTRLTPQDPQGPLPPSCPVRAPPPPSRLTRLLYLRLGPGGAALPPRPQEARRRLRACRGSGPAGPRSSWSGCAEEATQALRSAGLRFPGSGGAV